VEAGDEPAAASISDGDVAEGVADVAVEEARGAVPGTSLVVGALGGGSLRVDERALVSLPEESLQPRCIGAHLSQRARRKVHRGMTWTRRRDAVRRG
jgi:hypothetical protein